MNVTLKYENVEMTLKRRCKNHVFETLTTNKINVVANVVKDYTFVKVLFASNKKTSCLFKHNKFANETLVLIATEK